MEHFLTLMMESEPLGDDYHCYFWVTEDTIKLVGIVNGEVSRHGQEYNDELLESVCGMLDEMGLTGNFVSSVMGVFIYVSK